MNDFIHSEYILGTVGIVTLGCARNLVDSQGILGQLKLRGHTIVDAQKADTVIVNTCGFIEDAKKESIDTILELIALKKKGHIKRIILAGCLAQRYADDLHAEFTEVDAIVGIPQLDEDSMRPQVPLTPPHYAYLKICESCFNACSFCAIPLIKGIFRSRTKESITEEVAFLDAKGIRELNIIGQDITAYGLDLYGQREIADLLKKIAGSTSNVDWIRLLYAYPDHVTDELLSVIAEEKKICKYLDIPLQHVSAEVLAAMNRTGDEVSMRALVGKIRDAVPSVSIRTAFIVGFPGETDKHFEQLCGFVRDVRFERLGAFMYSREEGTAAYDLPQQVADEVKQQRYDILMQIQREISSEDNRHNIGKTLSVLVDGPDENDPTVYIGRTEHDAPEVDGVVYIRSKSELSSGTFYPVRISEALEYDLVGEVVFTE